MDLVTLIVTALIIFVFDIIWLTATSPLFKTVIEKIRGEDAEECRCFHRLPPFPYIFLIIPVYIALAYVLLQIPATASLYVSGLVGVAIYLMIEFTLISLFREYPLYLAAMDTVWGGILFMLATFIARRLGISGVAGIAAQAARAAQFR
jgi:uncharacterized membrane protein